MVEFIPVGVFSKANNFGFLFGSHSNVEHNIAVIRVRIKVTDVPVTNQVSTCLVGNCEVYC